MLHTKFLENQSTGSREEFLMILPYMGVAAILVMWSRCREQTIIPPTHRGSKQILALIGQSVSEEKMYEECERTTTDAGAWV